jgi:probable F420-dependent oxidoreductase
MQGPGDPCHSEAMTTKPQVSTTITTFANEDPGSFRHLVDRARAADAAGIDRIVCSDHVAYGENLEAYGDPKNGGAAGGKQPTGPDGIWLEPLTFLTTVGAVTENVRLGTNILLAALRRPVVLAKVLATMDVLTDGRLDIGIGVGWQAEEYTAAGLDFATRGRQLDHTIEVCQLLWREQVASYDSPELKFDKIHQMPKPRQEGGVPIWVSGTVNKRSARRLAKFGSGWIPWGDDAGNLVESIPAMRALVEAEGGDPNFDVVGNATPVRDAEGAIDFAATFAGAAPMVEAGVTDVRVGGIPPTGNYDDDLAVFQGVVKAFRAALH